MAQLSKAEEQRIAEFVERVTDMPPNQLRMVAMSELSFIYNRKKADGQKYSVLTNRNLVAAYRHALAEKFGEFSEASKYMRYSPARKEEYDKHQAEARKAKHRDVRPLDPDEFVNTALVLLGEVMFERWSNPKAIAALCALTGRRPVEVALRGQFTPVEGSKYEVVFSGQAKTRDPGRADMSYVIPILGDRDTVLQALEELRSKVDQNIDNKQFSAKYNKEIGLASKKAFQDGDGKPLIPSDLREAYAAVAYYEFADRNVLDIAYKSEILGHKFIDTTLDYLGFYLESFE
ncbi:protelomerase family protein [Nocardia sp. 852002-51101_SCH5132738]|uniref:protelomerase family protein n=1 Tax=Nocardia sp. 852002-51101_SCH5132738 TaxID=1834095 RepID=UPI000AD98819|nr:protelomerase family protein [Nocardia sp. 852002-51101_SCH5132738]